MSSLCYCCCRLTLIKSWTQGYILTQSHCEKCLTLLMEELNHKTGEHSWKPDFYAALLLKRQNAKSKIHIMTCSKNYYTSFHCPCCQQCLVELFSFFDTINASSFSSLIFYREKKWVARQLCQISSIVLDPYFSPQRKNIGTDSVDFCNYIYLKLSIALYTEK